MLRGEVWLLNLDPTVGAKIRKTCPVEVLLWIGKVTMFRQPGG